MSHPVRVLPLLLLLPLLPLAPAGAETDHPIHVATVAHGVTLSLIVPRSVYPRGAITRATVRVQNLFRQAITILPGCAFQFDNPEVEALTPGRVMRYPPAVRSINPNPSPACTGGGAVGSGALKPGISTQRAVFAVVGARRLRAMVALAPLGPNHRIGRSIKVVGRTLSVRLVESLRTRIVPCSTSYACVHVLPPAGARVTGPLYYAYSAKCEDANGNAAYSQQLVLAPTASTTLHIGCGAPLVELHLVAGWLNEPVDRIDRVFRPGGESFDR